MPQITTLRKFWNEAGLTRTGRGRVVLTKLGQRAVSDSAALWERVAGALATGEDFVCAIRELLLVKLPKGRASVA